jgi:hypothetical protein
MPVIDISHPGCRKGRIRISNLPWLEDGLPEQNNGPRQKLGRHKILLGLGGIPGLRLVHGVLPIS